MKASSGWRGKSCLVETGSGTVQLQARRRGILSFLSPPSRVIQQKWPAFSSLDVFVFRVKPRAHLWFPLEHPPLRGELGHLLFHLSLRDNTSAHSNYSAPPHLTVPSSACAAGASRRENRKLCSTVYSLSFELSNRHVLILRDYFQKKSRRAQTDRIAQLRVSPASHYSRFRLPPSLSDPPRGSSLHDDFPRRKDAIYSQGNLTWWQAGSHAQRLT